MNERLTAARARVEDNASVYLAVDHVPGSPLMLRDLKRTIEDARAAFQALDDWRKLLDGANDRLSGLWDIGDDGHGGPGWQSDELKALVEAIRAALDSWPERS